jgi:hypothetical protein
VYEAQYRIEERKKNIEKETKVSLNIQIDKQKPVGILKMFQKIKN